MNKIKKIIDPHAGEKKRWRRRPMTLIEVLIATFILALGLVGIMSLVPVAIRQAGDALQPSYAASVAHNAKVSLMRGQLDLYSSAYGLETGISLNPEDYTESILVIGDHPDTPAGVSVFDFTAAGVSNEYIFDTGTAQFVRDVPEGEDFYRLHGWTAMVDFEPDGAGSRLYHVEISVYFPSPFEYREVYRTTFIVPEPTDE